jgi:hypothetical protein
VRKVLIDVVLELCLDVGDVNVELYEIAIEFVILVFEEAVSLLFELGDVVAEHLKDGLNVLQVVLLERLELLFGAEKVDELGDAPFEEVKAAEDLCGREIELFRLGHVLQSLLCKLVLVDVGLVQLQARSQDVNKFIMWDFALVPENAIIKANGILPSFLLGLIYSSSFFEC